MNGVLDQLACAIQEVKSSSLWLSNGSIARAHHLHDFAHRKVVKSASAVDWLSYGHLEIKSILCYDQLKQHTVVYVCM